MHDFSRGTIIVTGGAGLIGSALIWALNRRGLDDILVVDRLDESSKWRNLVPLRFGDYCEADDFAEQFETNPQAFGEVSAVFHLGACSATTEADAGYLMFNNYEYTKRIAQVCLAHEIRFVYASSAATYGGLEENLSDTLDLATLRPLNAYAFSKHRFDSFAQTQGWLEHICGIKYFNVFGPNEAHKGDMRSLVDKAYGQIRETGSVRLFQSHRPEFRDGEQQRDFIYVKDAVEMTLHLAQCGASGLYNVGSGKTQTWLALVRPIFAAMQVPERIEFIPMPPSLRDKYQYSTCARIDRLRESGYTAPVTPLADAVHDYVTHYLLPDRHLDPSHDAAVDAPIVAGRRP